jgi:predicted enzyme related to lactoylglutathione lyase
MFGWKFEKFTLPAGMDYLIITTTDEQENKAIGGGMMKRQNPQHVMTNYIGVKSVDEYSANFSIMRKGSYVKKSFQEWVFLLYVLILRAIALGFGK